MKSVDPRGPCSHCSCCRRWRCRRAATRLRARAISCRAYIKTIGIPLFVNHTSVASMGQTLTDATVTEFIGRGRRVQPDTTGVDAILTATITSVITTPIAFTPGSRQQSRAADRRHRGRRVQGHAHRQGAVVEQERPGARRIRRLDDHQRERSERVPQRRPERLSATRARRSRSRS